MGFINALIQNRWAMFAGLRSDNVEELLKTEESPSTRWWKCWVFAETARQRGDIGLCFRWLEAAQSVPADFDPLWEVEYTATLGKALYANGEPGQAFARLTSAYAQWRRISDEVCGVYGTEGFAELIASVRRMVSVLLGEEQNQWKPSSVEMLKAWQTDRVFQETSAVGRELIQISGLVGAPEEGRKTGEDLLQWIRSDSVAIASPEHLSEVHLELCNMEQSLGNTEAALEQCERAINLLRPLAGQRHIDVNLAVLEFNRANGLMALGAFDEAVDIYPRVIEVFRSGGYREPELRARYAHLFTCWKNEGSTLNLDELRQLIIEYEDYAKSTAGQSEYGVAKESLEPLYRLLLTSLADSRRVDVATINEVLGLISGLRNERLLADLEMAAETSLHRLPPFLKHPLALLESRLARLPSTALWLWEPGVDRVVLSVITSGSGSLNERAILTTGGQDLTAAVEDLIVATRDASDVLIARGVGANELSDAAVKAAGERLAEALPTELRELLASVETVLFSPSAFGNTEELPIELMRVGDHYFGIEHIVARTPSLRRLLATLAPNNFNRLPSHSAAVIRAQDPPSLDPLAAADDDAERVLRYARLLELEPTLLVAPSSAQAREMFDADMRLVHYVGHGMASEAGEVLFLSEENVLPASALDGLSGARTPFVYLSACLVGQARHLRGGLQKGFGVALLDAGAPGVIAATYAVPDHLCSEIAKEFYRGAWKETVGPALRQARERLHEAGKHPVCWAGFALQGDPHACISEAVQAGGSAGHTLDWPSYLTRFLATDDEQYRQLCLDALDAELERRQQHAAVLEHVESWIRSHGTGDSNALAYERLIDEVALFDAEGAAAMQCLLILERLETLLTSTDKDSRIDELGKEIGSGLNLAVALSDSYAFLLFASYHAAELMVDVQETIAVLRHAERCLSAISVDVDRVTTLVERLSLQREMFLNPGNILLDLPSMLGVDPDVIQRADAGDESALREINSLQMARMSSPEVAARRGGWAHWLLREIGAGSEQALRDAMAAVQIDKENYAIDRPLADGLWKLLEMYRGPGEADATYYERVRNELQDQPDDLQVIEVFRLWDTISSHPRDFAEADAKAGLSLASRLGDAGVIARFSFLAAEARYRAGDLEQAKQQMLEGLQLLEPLVSTDSEYRDVLKAAANNARSFSLMLGDSTTAQEIENRYSDLLRESLSDWPNL